MQQIPKNNLRDFLRYNNAVPLVLAIMIIVSGSAFAATPTGQETISKSIVGKVERVISVDNTYIANINLDTWSPKVKVISVNEDSNSFYVNYTLSTIDNKEYKWQPVDENLTLTVDKSVLSSFKSLSDYVKYELSQKIDSEKDRLVRTQAIEKNNITTLQTVTTYTGLAGLVLDDSTRIEDPFAPAPASRTPGVANTVTEPTQTNQPTQTSQSETNLNITPVIDTTIISTSTTATTTATTSSSILNSTASTTDETLTPPQAVTPPVDATTTTTQSNE